jgi:hypothetical protein
MSFSWSSVTSGGHRVDDLGDRGSSRLRNWQILTMFGERSAGAGLRVVAAGRGIG